MHILYFVATILPRETNNFYDVVNAIWRDVVLVSITSEVNAPVSCMQANFNYQSRSSQANPTLSSAGMGREVCLIVSRVSMVNWLRSMIVIISTAS